MLFRSPKPQTPNPKPQTPNPGFINNLRKMPLFGRFLGYGLVAVLLCVLGIGVLGRPSEVAQSTWCEVCQALVKNLKNRLGEKRKEYEVLEAYDGICKNGNFNGYSTSAYQMGRICNDFVSDYEDELIEGMRTRKNAATAENDICVERTKACVEDNSDTSTDL